MRFLLTILLFPFICYAQTDTLANAKAWKSTYMGQLNAPITGLTTNGHIYAAFFVDTYDTLGVQQNITINRLDLNTGEVTSKLLLVKNTTGNWINKFDSLGNFYIAISRNIYKFNLKDSIYYRDLGGINPGIGALAYSISLGTDNKMYFGGSSGGTFLAVYDPYADTLHRYANEINSFQDYVLDVAGSSDGYIYAQVGQRDSNEVWAIKKTDESKTLLMKVVNSTRFAFEIRNTGIYVSGGTYGTRKMINGAISAQTSIPVSSRRNTYYEVNNPDVGGYPRAICFFNPTTSFFQYRTSTGFNNNVYVRTSFTPNLIKYIFFNCKDSGTLYYVGDDYGNFYKYNLNTNTSTPLGNSGYNIYSSIQYNDSLIFTGSYPSGTVMRFHLNPATHAWTTQTWDVINNFLITGTQLGDNPRIEGTLHSTLAEVHHIFQMALSSDGHYIGLAGDVIRTGATAGIGSAVPIKTGLSAINGYDSHKLINLGSSDLIAWRNLFIWSTSDYNGGHPKLYFYNPATNVMEDSIDLNYTDYGRIFIIGDKLIGVTPNIIYKVDLPTKTLIDSRIFAANSIGSSLQLSDGRILINTNNTLPTIGFWNFVRQPYSTATYYEFNKNIYYISNFIIKRVRNVVFSYHSRNETFNRLAYIKNCLGIN